MRITPAVLLSAVLAQIAVFALSIALWSKLSVADWVANSAWVLVALAFLSGFFEKRHCYSSICWKRTRVASALSGIVVLISYLVATRVFGFAGSDTSSALIVLGGLGPFMFLGTRAFGRRRSTSVMGGKRDDG
jgi:hypothetical protein